MGDGALIVFIGVVRLIVGEHGEGKTCVEGQRGIQLPSAGDGFQELYSWNIVADLAHQSMPVVVVALSVVALEVGRVLR